MSELKIGTKVKDRYTLKEYKGSGSFGEVWLAYDEVLDCEVAVKIYISLDPRGVEEFKSEYITTQGLSHPNLLTTNYFDVWQQRPYLVMKYCAKGSSSRLAGQLNEYDIWQFIHDVAAGLCYLHSLPEPIIHQDIKPDNILVDDSNRYLITDFGISKKIRSTMRKQSMRAVGAGATAYMGPERFGSDSSPVKASDIWSLGVSIYELATGELPFSGLGGGMQKNGAELPTLGNQWSKELNMVMQSCLAKETWDRPTAKQLEAYSSAILKGEEAVPEWTVSNNTETTQGSSVGNDSTYVAPENASYEIYPEEPHSNKKRIWLAVGGIIAAILLLILIWPTSNSDEDAMAVPEDNFEEVDSAEVVEVAADTIVTYAADTSTEAEKPKTVESKQETPKPENTDGKAARLKKALTNGDYKEVQILANEGYKAAYFPLADYYMKHKDYQVAEIYAKKAVAAGDKDGNMILVTLTALGYYD